jgi:hypothetical membrane protein
VSTDYQRIGGTVLIVGTVQFLIAMLVSESLYPGYSRSQNFISDLGVGPVASIFNTSIILFGVAVLVAGYMIARSLRSIILLVLLIVTGLGAMGVGIFPETAGGIHTVVSAVAFIFGGLSAIATYMFQKPPLRYFSAVMGLLALVALVLYSTGQFLGLGPGGMERLIAYPELLWGLVFGGHLVLVRKPVG